MLITGKITSVENVNLKIDSYRPFPSSKNSHFQTRLIAKTFAVKMSFDLHDNEKAMPYQWLRTQPRFEQNGK